ncbi:type IV secretion system protein TraC [Cedecea sp. NFIX57]|uniref:type IV secretion system protein TraC n=1 Tax=Cedecea sp. NFIX57 TaxID=1566286 RepID=UPI000A0DCABA|nr:type IV secretion system protein TraC [Cedecea sp. NFIX57]SMG60313.1 conjugal transfer ATP-binding protein TraC [Cedecea sp. NFIX57]
MSHQTDDVFTQTLTRLWHAVRAPSGATAANRALENLNYPRLSSLLPYRGFDAESGLFINKSTVGFLLKATPLIGANTHIVEVLNDLVKSKLPRKTPISFHLVSSPLIGDDLDRGLADFAWQGKEEKKFNAITRAYYQRAARTRFATPTGLPLTLRNYELYIAYAVKRKASRAATITTLAHLMKVVRATLDSAKLLTEVVDESGLLNLVSSLVNYRPDQLYPPALEVAPYDDLNMQCVENGIDFAVHPAHLTVTLPEPERAGQVSSARAINFLLDKNPDLFLLWQGGENISNLLNPDLSIPFPFVLTFTLEAEDQVATQNEANRKFLDLDRKAASTLAKLLPNLVTQRDEWQAIRGRLLSGDSCLVRHYLNMTVFCRDSDDDALVCGEKVINTFKKNGLNLYSPGFMQHRDWMAMLPFMAAEGLWNDLKATGVTHRCESIQAVNLIPAIADNRLCEKGMPVPGYRGQLAFLDLFGKGMGNTNNNMGVTGTSGAGKTGMVQPLLRSILDDGGLVWVFDMGDGYKSFCENMGGTYINAATLSFNPFAGVTDIRLSGERIRDQLSVLASPDGNLDEVHEDLLLDGVMAAWTQKGNAAHIDDVVDYLKAEVVLTREAGAESIARRLDEIIRLLGKYCRGGLYADYFNSDKPALQNDARMVVLEMGSLQDRPALLVAVMFSLIIYIEDRMYRSPRNLKKCCTIDEGWKLLNFKNEKVGHFIETGYRTVRRHNGAFITITQNIKDFDSDDASSASKAAWGNSAFKVIAKQDAAEFKTYCERNPTQFSDHERQIIERFGDAKDQWFSAFMLRTGAVSSFHRLFVDPLSRAMFSSKGEDFEFREARLAEGWHLHDVVYALAKRNFPDEMKELEAWRL